jgi:hypothetical protein
MGIYKSRSDPSYASLLYKLSYKIQLVFIPICMICHTTQGYEIPSMLNSGTPFFFQFNYYTHDELEKGDSLKDTNL